MFGYARNRPHKRFRGRGSEGYQPQPTESSAQWNTTTPLGPSHSHHGSYTHPGDTAGVNPAPEDDSPTTSDGLLTFHAALPSALIMLAVTFGMELITLGRENMREGVFGPALLAGFQGMMIGAAGVIVAISVREARRRALVGLTSVAAAVVTAGLVFLVQPQSWEILALTLGVIVAAAASDGILRP